MSQDHLTEPRVDCTAGPDGRIEFAVTAPPSAPQARLLLRLRPAKGLPERTVRLLDLEPGPDGRPRAVLEPSPVLEDGRWDVYLVPGPDAGRQRLRHGLRDLRALVDGHTRDRRAPVAVRVPYATTDGHLCIRAWLRDAHAEAGRIEVTERSTRVEARLHGATLAEGAAVVLRLRGGSRAERTLEPRCEADGRGFSFVVDHTAVADERGTWDVFVRPAAHGPRVRVARLLDDVAGRKDVFVYPAVPAGTATVRPCYTGDNDLALTVTAPDVAQVTGSRPGVADSPQS
ncbi:transferase [Streptomyces sp. NPDC093094]|uniref:transferase n=1 Tax=Streptomyces sp. NPDC093094 TaxID=3366026 RepID=UPI0037F2AF76